MSNRFCDIEVLCELPNYYIYTAFLMRDSQISSINKEIGYLGFTPINEEEASTVNVLIEESIKWGTAPGRCLLWSQDVIMNDTDHTKCYRDNYGPSGKKEVMFNLYSPEGVIPSQTYIVFLERKHASSYSNLQEEKVRRSEKFHFDDKPELHGL